MVVPMLATIASIGNLKPLVNQPALETERTGSETLLDASFIGHPLSEMLKLSGLKRGGEVNENLISSLWESA